MGGYPLAAEDIGKASQVRPPQLAALLWRLQFAVDQLLNVRPLSIPVARIPTMFPALSFIISITSTLHYSAPLARPALMWHFKRPEVQGAGEATLTEWDGNWG